MKKANFLFLFALVASLLFWSCGGGEGSADGGASEEPAGNATGVTDTEITIGSFGPLTGPAALWGNIMKGMDAYFKMVNEEGGVNGRQVNFVMKDDAYDPSRTVPAVRELVQRDEIFAMVGGIGTAPCMSILDYMVEEDIPWVSPISGATNWSIPPKNNVFSVLPYYIDEGIIQARYALDSLKTDKIGIIYQNDDVGKSALVGAKHHLKKNNLDFLVEVPVEITDTDLSSHVAKLKDSGAEVVLLWTLPRQGVITVVNSNVINYKPQFIASFILSDMTLMHDLTKGAWKDVIFGSFAAPPYDLENPEIAKYKAAMEKYYPEVRWGVFPFAGFLYAKPFTAALEKLGKDVTREGLVKEMEALKDFDLLGMKMTYGAGNRQGVRSMQLLKCVSGSEYEILSDYIDSDPNIEELIHQLEAM